MRDVPKLTIHIEKQIVKVACVKQPNDIAPFAVDIPVSDFVTNGVNASEQFGLAILRCLASLYPDQVDLAQAAAGSSHRHDLLMRVIHEALHDRSAQLLPAIECMLGAWSPADDSIGRFRADEWPDLRHEIEGFGPAPT